MIQITQESYVIEKRVYDQMLADAARLRRALDLEEGRVTSQAKTLQEQAKRIHSLERQVADTQGATHWREAYRKVLAENDKLRRQNEALLSAAWERADQVLSSRVGAEIHAAQTHAYNQATKSTRPEHIGERESSNKMMLHKIGGFAVEMGWCGSSRLGPQLDEFLEERLQERFRAIAFLSYIVNALYPAGPAETALFDKIHDFLGKLPRPKDRG